MNSKRLLVIVTEGATDQIFYKQILKTIKKVNGGGKFNFDKIKHIDAKGITKFKRKIITKFKEEFGESSKYKDYEKVVCLCYDLDVFHFSSRPKINWDKIEGELRECGANHVIQIKADKTIEDFFLYDIEGVKKYLRLRKKYKTPKKNGLNLIKQMFKDRNRVYMKGERVQGLVECLNLEKILSNICDQIKLLCNELGYQCKGDKCKNQK